MFTRFKTVWCTDSGRLDERISPKYFISFTCCIVFPHRVRGLSFTCDSNFFLVLAFPIMMKLGFSKLNLRFIELISSSSFSFPYWVLSLSSLSLPISSKNVKGARFSFPSYSTFSLSVNVFSTPFPILFALRIAALTEPCETSGPVSAESYIPNGVFTLILMFSFILYSNL